MEIVGHLGHIGHLGTGADGLWAGLIHPFTGVDHLLAMVAVGVLAAVAGRRVAWATPGGFVAGTIGGAALGLAGVTGGLVERAVAVSLVVLGALIATTLVPRLRVGSWAPAVALALGAVHGLAHGAESPASGSGVAFVAGLAVATVALHLFGVALGSTVGRRPLVRAAIAGLVSVTGVAMVGLL